MPKKLDQATSHFNMALRDDTSSSSSGSSDKTLANIFGDLGATILTAKIPTVALRSGHGGKDIFIAYQIEVYDKKGAKWNVSRRYREFEALNIWLTSNFPGEKFPYFPGKVSSLWKSPETVAAERLPVLSEYVAGLLRLKASILSSYEVLDFFGYIEETQSREQYASLFGGFVVISDFEFDNLHRTNIHNGVVSVSIGQSAAHLHSHPYGTSKSSSAAAVRANTLKINQAFQLTAPSLSTPVQIVLQDSMNASASVRFSIDLQELLEAGENEQTYTISPVGLAHQEGWSTLDNTIVPRLRARAVFKRGGTLRRP